LLEVDQEEIIKFTISNFNSTGGVWIYVSEGKEQRPTLQIYSMRISSN